MKIIFTLEKAAEAIFQGQSESRKLRIIPGRLNQPAAGPQKCRRRLS